ncbi:DUF4352 domain-containing protein [Paenibacillus shunpengii]|uniref:DUF4352 domain-containing protein n=1 Tax=Paenibacillus shunpengii TaxID=2054424 RepID=A0ABW5SSS2_9BACL
MEDSTRQFPRKNLYILIAIVAAIIVIIAVRLAADNNGPSFTSSNAPISQNLTLGDRVTVGEYTFMFDGFEVSEQGDESDIVTFSGSVTNDTREPITVYTTLIELTDGYNTFAHSSNTISGEINPGLSENGEVTFEIPKNTTDLRLVVHSNMFGGGETATIYLEDTQ